MRSYGLPRFFFITLSNGTKYFNIFQETDDGEYINRAFVIETCIKAFKLSGVDLVIINIQELTKEDYDNFLE